MCDPGASREAETSQPGVTLFRFVDEFEAVTVGQAIFTAGQPGDVMYVVNDGEVDVIINGKVVETVGPGGVLGEMALIDKGPRSASAVAKTDCKLVSVDEQHFQRLVQQTPY